MGRRGVVLAGLEQESLCTGWRGAGEVVFSLDNGKRGDELTGLRRDDLTWDGDVVC